MDIRRARAVKAWVLDRTENEPAVVGVGLRHEGKEYQVAVNLSEPLKRKLPSEHDGVRIVCTIVGPIGFQGAGSS